MAPGAATRTIQIPGRPFKSPADLYAPPAATESVFAGGGSRSFKPGLFFDLIADQLPNDLLSPARSNGKTAGSSSGAKP
jgi:hypothetical protein